MMAPTTVQPRSAGKFPDSPWVQASGSYTVEIPTTPAEPTPGSFDRPQPTGPRPPVRPGEAFSRGELVRPLLRDAQVLGDVHQAKELPPSTPSSHNPERVLLRLSDPASILAM